MHAFTDEAFILSRLDGEKIPGVAKVADEIEAVHPGMPYPSHGFGLEAIAAFDALSSCPRRWRCGRQRYAATTPRV